MSDGSFQEKTEDPTPKRKEDAREKGEIPRSREVNTAVLLLGGAVVINLTGGDMAREIEGLFRGSLSALTAPPVGLRGWTNWLDSVLRLAFLIIAPAVLALAGLALASAGAQAQGVFTAKSLEPKWSRLNPVSNARNICGMKAVAELAKSLLKLAVVAVAVFLASRSVVPGMSALVGESPGALVAFLRDSTVRLLAYAGGAYLLLALADYSWERWRHHKRLRMTRQEVKEEKKNSEGDPMVRMRRRNMARSLARRRMILSVSEADVVVTNPTHLAIALRYDASEAEAPVVLAMGARKMALRIKDLAREAGVTMVENRPLARALYQTAEVGEMVPVELYVAVAEVLAFVYRQNGSTPS